MCNSEEDEVVELDAKFFANAILSRPGENLLDVVQRERGEKVASAPKSDNQL